MKPAPKLHIDWPELLDRHGVGYDVKGRSVSPGNINVECPFCRDGKRKMGIKLETGQWGCRKRNDHRGAGRNPRMLSALLGISRNAASEILGTRVVDSSIAGLRKQLEALGTSRAPQPRTETRLPDLELPLEFFALREHGPRSQPFLRYLKGRGLPFEAVARYQLHGCDCSSRGAYIHRVYLPLFQDGRQVGFTGRAIDGNPQRYETQPPAAPVRVLGLSQLAQGGQVLVVVEGPFDALWLDWVAYKERLPISVVCLMGSASTRAKNAVLAKLARKYNRTIGMLDSGAEGACLELQRAVATEVEFRSMVPGFDDPGDLPWDAARSALRAFLE